MRSAPTVGLIAHPHLVEEAAARGHDGLRQLYLETMMDGLSSYRFSWWGAYYALGMVGAVLILELLVNGWARSALRRILTLADGSTRHDVFYWLLGVTGLSGLIRFLITLGGASAVYYAVERMTLDIALVERIDNPVFQYAFAFLVMDLMGYVQHRLAHSWGWWWELHKIHHSAESFNMITAYRTHVLENIPRAVVYGIAISFTGSWQAFVFYAALLEIHNLLVHSEIQFRWERLEHVLVTPRNHKIHHSMRPEHHDRNFGFTLIVWDRLFGTYHRPRDGESFEIGLKDNPFNKANPLMDLFTAYRNCIRKVLGSD